VGDAPGEHAFGVHVRTCGAGGQRAEPVAVDTRTTTVMST